MLTLHLPGLLQCVQLYHANGSLQQPCAGCTCDSAAAAAAAAAAGFALMKKVMSRMACMPLQAKCLQSRDCWWLDKMSASVALQGQVQDGCLLQGLAMTMMPPALL